MYIKDRDRKRAEEEFIGPQEEFLASLEMILSIFSAKEEDLERAEELTSRTNQLNTTGYTYSLEELEHFRESNQHRLLMAALEEMNLYEDTIVVVSERGLVHAYESVDGKTRWKQAIGHRVYIEPCTWDRFLAIAGDEGALTVLDTESGIPRWSKRDLGLIEQRPTTDGERVLVAVDRWILPFDLASGEEHPKLEARRRLTAPPAAVGETILAGRDDGPSRP